MIMKQHKKWYTVRLKNAKHSLEIATVITLETDESERGVHAADTQVIIQNRNHWAKSYAYGFNDRALFQFLIG